MTVEQSGKTCASVGRGAVSVASGPIWRFTSAATGGRREPGPGAMCIRQRNHDRRRVVERVLGKRHLGRTGTYHLCTASSLSVLGVVATPSQALTAETTRPL